MAGEYKKTTTGMNTARQEPSPIPPLLLGVDEAAGALRISRTSLYALMGSGTLAFVKIGKRRLVAVSALDALVESLGEVAK